MLKSMTGALVATLAFGALGLPTTGASAMPMIDRAPAVATAAVAAGAVQEARLICGPYRCFHRPDYYRPFYPAYGYGYGWHRGWHGGWRGGWHHGWHRGW